MPHALPLVKIKGEPDVLPAAGIVLDPHLAIDGHVSLLLRHVYDVDSALDYLGHRILLRPHELRSHVQRILLLVRKEDGASLYGALVDLLIALQDKGVALKLRMLEHARTLLTQTSLVFLRQHLESGLMACDPTLARVRSSLLRKGYCGDQRLVHRIGAATTAEQRSPLDEAHELLAYGQLDQALETLENALLMEPDQAEIVAELLDLYGRMGELERMESMREQMMINFGRVPESWSVNPSLKGVSRA
ncbi:MAG: tetratricopeptide repeat protein [Halothiobacillaceae bacterium]|nr:MAG: tetratricopeptide repeat protein [Halothiobacillaceae bacterium]